MEPIDRNAYYAELERLARAATEAGIALVRGGLAYVETWPELDDMRKACTPVDLLALIRDLRATRADAAEQHAALARVWNALGVHRYDGREVSEHIDALRAERDRLAAACRSALDVFDNTKIFHTDSMDIYPTEREHDQLRAALAPAKP